MSFQTRPGEVSARMVFWGWRKAVAARLRNESAVEYGRRLLNGTMQNATELKHSAEESETEGQEKG